MLIFSCIFLAVGALYDTLVILNLLFLRHGAAAPLIHYHPLPVTNDFSYFPPPLSHLYSDWLLFVNRRKFE